MTFRDKEYSVTNVMGIIRHREYLELRLNNYSLQESIMSLSENKDLISKNSTLLEEIE